MGPRRRRDEDRASVRAARVLDQGPALPARQQPGGRARMALRALLLRTLRPYSAHQRQLDGELVQALRDHEAAVAGLEEELERSDERLQRLELYVGDLTSALDALRQRVEAGEQTSHR